MPAMKVLRSILARPPFRAVLKTPAVERVVATVLRARTVRESSRFAARELTGRRTTHRYRLRDSGLIAVVRHGTPDLATLDEVFYQGQYRLPLEVAEALGSSPRAVDLGANIGLFALWLTAERPGARLTVVEPDPGNADVLRRTCDLNALEWEIVEAVAATHDGSAPFAAGRFSLSRVEDRADLPHVRAVDAFGYLADADLAKIDIEGSEWDFLGLVPTLARRPPYAGPRVSPVSRARHRSSASRRSAAGGSGLPHRSAPLDGAGPRDPLGVAVTSHSAALARSGRNHGNREERQKRGRSRAPGRGSRCAERSRDLRSFGRKARALYRRLGERANRLDEIGESRPEAAT